MLKWVLSVIAAYCLLDAFALIGMGEPATGAFMGILGILVGFPAIVLWKRSNQ